MKFRSLLFGTMFIAGCSWQDACGIKDLNTQQGQAICGNAIMEAQNSAGREVFNANCATCHHPWKDATGPALRGVLGRWDGDTAALFRYIRHTNALTKERKGYIRFLKQKWKSGKPGFPELTDQQLRDILAYVGD